jgi:hypothetical protein
MKRAIGKAFAIELLKLGWELSHDVPYSERYELTGVGIQQYTVSGKIGDELVKSRDLIEVYHQSGIHIYKWNKEEI